MSVFVFTSGPNLTRPRRTAASGKLLGPLNCHRSRALSAGRRRLAWLQRLEVQVLINHLYIPARHIWHYYDMAMCSIKVLQWGETGNENRNDQINTLGNSMK